MYMCIETSSDTSTSTHTITATRTCTSAYGKQDPQALAPAPETSSLQGRALCTQIHKAHSSSLGFGLSLVCLGKYTQSLVGERDSWVFDAIMLLSLLQEITNGKESEPLVDLETKFVQVLRSFNKIQQTFVSINESDVSKRPKRAASDAPTPELPDAKKQAKKQARSLFQDESPVTQSDEEGTALEVADSQPDHFEGTQVPIEDSISELDKQPVL